MNAIKWLSGEKRRRLTISVAIILVVFITIVPTIFAKLSTQNLRYEIEDQSLPDSSVALVFGAGVYADGRPTPYLKNRVETAVRLLKQGKVQKILMSGDNSDKHYNEPIAMRSYAIELGAATDDIVLDYAGLSTYDTCYRAKEVFGVQDAILVTQGYHLPRAVMTCSALGVKSHGVAAQKQERDYTVGYVIREFAATSKDLVQTLIKPKPSILGAPQPIN